MAVGGFVPLIRRLGVVPHVGGRRHQDRLTARSRRRRAADGRGGHVGRRTVGVVVVRYAKTKTAVGTLVVVVAVVVVARRTTTLDVAVAS